MPTLFFTSGYRFFIYSNENKEPAHVHIAKGDSNGKLWLEPVMKIAYMHRFSASEQRKVLDLASSNYELLKEKWYEYFGE